MAKKRKDPAAVTLGRKGGRAKVPKGFAKMDPERLRQIGKDTAKKRWGNAEE